MVKMVKNTHSNKKNKLNWDSMKAKDQAEKCIYILEKI